jgi:sugar phosphate isomerase/epimerase
MKVGVLTDGIADLDFVEALDYVVEVGAQSVEFAAGSWSSAPHLDVASMESDSSLRRRFAAEIASRGLGISALNASGNQLHPVEGRRDDGLVRSVIRVAGELGVDTVVLMSGLPAAKGDSVPNWITASWPPEGMAVLDYQWNDVALPYWQELVAFATAAGVSKLAVEMHPNQLVYNVPSLLKLREEVGDTVGANFDPSHLIWMGADVLQAVRALTGMIHHVHAKDTRIEHARSAVRSRLETLTSDHVDQRAWNYVTVGRGMPGGADFWRQFANALDAAGYAGTLSIEHEDAMVSGVDGIAEAAALLRVALNSRNE